MTDARPNRNASGHKKRIPIGTRPRLSFEQEPGYSRRVVNDVEGRIEMFLDAGYEIVTKPTEGAPIEAGEATPMGSAVRKAVGGGVEGVLMQIPQEYYDEDQAAKEVARTKKELTVLEQSPDGIAEGEGVKIKRPGVMIE